MCQFGRRSVQAFCYPEMICDDCGHSIHAFSNLEIALQDGRRWFLHPEKLCVDVRRAVHAF